MTCQVCNCPRAIILRPKTATPVCKNCFFTLFEAEVHETITSNRLLERGDRVAVAVSGGKDSTVLAHVLCTLNRQYGYGVELVLLSVDEGIAGYRDLSLEAVRANRDDYGLELAVVPFKQIVGYTMDEVVYKISNWNKKVDEEVRNRDIQMDSISAKKSDNPKSKSFPKPDTSNCTFCGVFRRRALEHGAAMLKCNKIATGHNADDLAETALLNLIRGDSNRFFTCVDPKNNQKIARIKPFKYAYEKEIVLYAFHKNLKYFSTECTHSYGAHRGIVRTFIKGMEIIDPRIILNVVEVAGMYRRDSTDVRLFECRRCGEMTSSKICCMMCMLIEKLNKNQ